MQALVAQLFGNRHRDIGRLAAHQRRLVRRRGDDDAARQAFFGPRSSSMNSFSSRPRSPTSADDDRIGIGVAREHGEQRRLADAGAREDAHALAFAAGRECVERAHAEIELAADARARDAPRRCLAHRIGDRALWQRTFAVCRLRECIDHAAKPGFAGIDQAGLSSNSARAPERHAIETAKRHHNGAAIAEAYDLAWNLRAARMAIRTWPPRLIAPAAPVTSTEQTLNAGHAPEPAQAWEWPRFP